MFKSRLVMEETENLELDSSQELPTFGNGEKVKRS